jgi:phosphatidate cytidylyltransferase
MSCQCPGARVVLKTRIITALLMLVVLLIATAWTTPFQFALFISAVLLVGVLEWTTLMGLNGWPARLSYLGAFCGAMLLIADLADMTPAAAALQRPIVLSITGAGVLFWLLAFSLIRQFPERQARWEGVPKTALMGLLTLLPTWIALIQLKYLEPQGYLVLTLVGLVSIVDIGAFFTGRKWGRAKLAPKLSPAKSWAGFWGGVASCFALALLLLYPLQLSVEGLDLPRMLIFLLVALIVAVFSVLGDLFESMLKRSQGLKDSGKALPGHGGVLDRIDSLTSAAPVFVFSLLILFADVTWA